MRAGALRERITIQKKVKASTATKQQVGEWVDVCEIWAEAKCTTSSVIDGDGFTVPVAIWKFYIRRREGIAASMRVKWKGRIFQLQGPPVDWANERNGLTLITQELV